MVTLVEHVNYLEMQGIGGRNEPVSISYVSGNFQTEDNQTFSILSTDGVYRYNLGLYSNVVGFSTHEELYNFLDGIFKGASSVSLTDENNNPINVQTPLSTNGDSVYVKDINSEYSDNSAFSGVVTDYFDDLKSINTSPAGVNPRILMVWFNRTVHSHSIGIGCDDLAKGFGTDVTVKLLGSGEAVRFSKSFTGLNKNSALLSFGPKAFNGFVLEFNTANEVCLSNITIQKSTEGNVTLHGVDENGDVKEVNVTENGDLTISDNSDGLAIAEGRVTGKTSVNKFGYAPNFDVADDFVTVWDGAEAGAVWESMNYVYSTSADIDSLCAEDNLDTQTVEVQGLDSNFDLINQTKTLTGNTPVALDTALIRVFRMKNIDSESFRNHIFCYVGAGTTVSSGIPQDGTKVRAVIHAAENQTEMAVFTIPNQKTGYMRSWYASTAGAKKDSKHTIKILARPFGGVFQLKQRRNFTSETGLDPQPYDTPPSYGAKTDIEMVVDTDKDDSGASAGFNIVLVDQ